MSNRMRRGVHISCMIAIALLYVFSVPWYRDGDQPLRLWFGLPDWVAVALFCYIAVAILNAIAWSVAEVPDVPLTDDAQNSEARR